MLRENLDVSTVKYLGETTKVSGNKLEDLYKVFKLPENLNGIKVLDICTGQSDFADWLSQQGAKACAIDYLYQNIQALNQKRMETLVETVQRSWGLDVDNSQVEMTSKNELNKFTAMLESRRTTYITASAHALPFQDGSFDIAISFSGIFGVLDHDKRIASVCVNEALRVLKKNGKLQLAPALIGPDFSDQQIKNQREIFDDFRRDKRLKVSFSRRPFQGSFIGCIIISKRK